MRTMGQGPGPVGSSAWVLQSGVSVQRIAPRAGRSRLIRVGTAVCLAAVCGSALAQQVTPPSPGQILRNVEQGLPSRPMSSPEGANVEIPEAPAATPESMREKVSVRGYRIVGNTVFDEKTLLDVIAGRTGELSLVDLDAAAGELTRYYRKRGYLVARAYVPQQQIKDGIVTLAVLEGRYGQINTDGTSRVSDQRVRRTVGEAICPTGNECQGALIDRDALERGLLVLNDTPGVHVAGRLSPGAEIGTSALDLNVTAQPLLSGAVTLDNGGDYYTGNLRTTANLWINSPAHIGDQLTLQGVGSEIHGHLGYGALGYSVPLGYSGLSLGVRGWDLYYKLGDTYRFLNAHGIAYGGDATLSYPFIRSQSANLYGSLSYGQRHFHDYADTAGLSDTRQIRGRVEAGLNGDLQDDVFGLPAYNSYSLTYAEGRVDLDSTLWATDVLTAHTAGHYDKVNVTLSRLQSVFSRSALYLRVFAQSASKNLDAYEKFALGGPDAVRAYPASDSLTDKAFLYTVEWRQQLGQLFKGPLEGVVFYDHANGHTNAKPWQAGANVVTLQGVGGGLNWSIWQGTMLRSYVAVRGDRPWTAAPDHDVQYGLSLATTF